MSTFSHSGVIIPITTPFTTEGHVDLEAASRIVRRIARHNLGVFVLGTTGETASIPRPDRYRLVEAVVKAVDDKVPVYAGIGDNCMSNSVLAANLYRELGVTAVVAHLPSYYPLDAGEMLDYFKLMDVRLNAPWMIYNMPATTHMSIPVEVLEKLAGLENCVGFKDSEGSRDRMKAVYDSLGGRDDFALFMGSAVLSTEAMKLGFAGLVPSSGNLVPSLWEDFWKAIQSTNWELAQQLQDQLDAIAQIFQTSRSLGQSLAALKASLKGVDLCEPVVLPPLRTFNTSECLAIRDQVFQLCPFLQDEVRSVHADC